MALDKFLSIFQFKDDEDDFEDDDDYEDVKPVSRRSETTSRTERQTTQRPSYSDRSDRYDRSQTSRMTQSTASVSRPVSEPESEYRRERTDRYQRPERQPSKVVPMKASSRSGLEVSIAKPTSFDDSQDVCDLLIRGKAVVANLEGLNPSDAQRIMDFISGCVYAMNGNLHQISMNIFIFSPDSIDISGDFLDAVSADSFGVPTINRDF